MKKRYLKGQSVLEYAILLVIIMAVLLAMGTYFKRGVQGRWKSAVDDMGDQYDPTNASGAVTDTYDATVTTIITTEATGVGSEIRTNRVDNSVATQSSSGSIAIGP